MKIDHYSIVYNVLHIQLRVGQEGRDTGVGLDCAGKEWSSRGQHEPSSRKTLQFYWEKDLID